MVLVCKCYLLSSEKNCKTWTHEMLRILKDGALGYISFGDDGRIRVTQWSAFFLAASSH
jgi:hypothetical protein